VVVLWIVKQSPAALCFPFVLLVLVPIRFYLLPYAWSEEEIQALDGGAPPIDDKDEPDFYEQSHNFAHHSRVELDDDSHNHNHAS